jgi:hypothetical protein
MIGFDPVQVPGDAVRVCPTCVLPEIVGGEVFAGGAFDPSGDGMPGTL